MQLKKHLALSLIWLGLLLLPRPLFAGVEAMSEAEFRELAADIAPKVNLFRQAWKANPEAEFYGGTTRDFLYWIKGKFRTAHTHGEALKIAEGLRALPNIDVRDFIVGDSDVDIVTDRKLNLEAEEFGVRKIDAQDPSIFDPKSEAGLNERQQGFIPAEKIRLGQKGFTDARDLGQGLSEIYRGKLSVHFTAPEVFAQSLYAKEGLNHPVLLALRYLRLQAINYFQTHGRGYPDMNELLASMTPESAAAVKQVIAQAADGKELVPYLEEHKFVSWINGTIKKAYRSYTNPTAAKLLMQEFGASQLQSRYSEKIDPINAYIFSQYRDPKAIAGAQKKYGVDPSTFYQPPKNFFADGNIYHGTRTEEGFRSILFEGVMPSDDGFAGAGLYGVAEKNQWFAEGWGGSADRVVKLPVKADAKIVDITEGEGARIWGEYVKKAGEDFEGFAELFGADILKYPYKETEAFVVKNSDVLGHAQGVNRQILTFSQFVNKAKTMRDPEEFFKLLETNRFTEEEIRLAAAEAPFDPKKISALLKAGGQDEKILRYILHPRFKDHPEWVEHFLKSSRNWDKEIAKYVLSQAGWPKIDAWIKELIEKGTIDGELAENVLSQAYAAKYPGWVDALLAKNNTGTNDYVAAFVLTKPHYAPKEYARWIQTLHENNEDSALVYYVLGKSHIKPDPALLLKILRESRTKYDRHSSIRLLDENILEHVLSQPQWVGNSEIVDDILKAGKHDNLVAREILSRPGWPKQLEWAKEIIEYGDSDTVGEVVASALSEKHFYGNPELVHAAMAKVSPNYSFDGAIAGLFQTDPEHWHQYPAILEELLKRDRSKVTLATRILSNPIWADYPEYFVYLFGHGLEHDLPRKERRSIMLTNGVAHIIPADDPIAELLAIDHWRNHPVLRALCGGKDPTASCLEKASRSGALPIGVKNVGTCAGKFSQVVGR